ncbi:MAG: DUF4097 family beta strand repeat protein [Candidatus Aminicenantes bacterium]|nr:DUF4097 family beta strand repeat protein [Candidatus Aminicenantes bacterium]
MKAKEVILLILIILLGVGFHYLKDFRTSVDSWDFHLFRGHPFVFEESLQLKPAVTVEILNTHGRVEVEGAEVEKISVTLEKKVWARNEEEAKKIADRLKLLTTESPNGWLISSNRETFRKKSFETSFRLTVPRETAVKIKNSFGLVRVSKVKEARVENKHDQVDIFEISGPVKVINAFDEVSLMDISGACEVETRHAALLLSRISGPVRVDCAHEEVELFDLRNSISLESRHSKINGVKITGSAEISGSYEPMSFSEVTGSLTIKGHHSPITVDNLKGELRIENIYEPVKLFDLQGNVTVEGKSLDIKARRIRAEKIYLRTSYEDVRLEDFSGELHLELAHGDAFLAPATLSYPIEVKGRYADLNFLWPSGEICPFQAQSKGGEIKWELPRPYDEKKTNGTTIIRAFMGSKSTPRLNLYTTYGKIKVMAKD